ncbi:MAG: hypothetical protein C4523_05490, partial [Myxococcales bacterium]
QYGVAVPQGQPCKTIAEARLAAEKIFGGGHKLAVVKSQIHAGGRGKGTFKNGFQGGVKLAKSAEEAVAFAENMLGRHHGRFLSHGQHGRVVHAAQDLMQISPAPTESRCQLGGREFRRFRNAGQVELPKACEVVPFETGENLQGQRAQKCLFLPAADDVFPRRLDQP